MNKPAIRVILVVLLLGSVLAQVLVPVYASAFGTRNPEVAHLVIPYSVAAILFIGCGQVALLATWWRLSRVEVGISVTRRDVRWVDVITACASVATALTAGVLIHMLAVVPGGGGPTVYLLAVVIAVGIAFVLLMVAKRRRLVSTIADQRTVGPSPSN